MTARGSIALVVHDARMGLGQGRYVVELARALCDHYDLHIFANTFDPELPASIRCHPVPAWRRTALSTVLSFLVRSERAVRRARCDLIHAQGLTCWSADVVTAHICNQARLARAPADGWRRRVFPGVVIPIERAFYRAPGKRHAIAISHLVGKELSDHYGWRRPMTVIPHGVDTDRFRPLLDAEERCRERARYGLGSEDWVWLFMGEASKGAGAALVQLPSFPKARLLVVSRSPSREFLEKARTLGVVDRLVWAGPEAEPERAYRAADVFVYPSDYDAFGMVVTEAMASGLPLVVSRSIGAAELVEHERNGLLVAPKDASQLAAAIRWIQDHGDRAAAMGKAARQSALACSWSRCAARTAEVYEGLLHGSPASA